MTHDSHFYDAHRSALGALISQIDHEIAQLPPPRLLTIQHATDDAEKQALRESWQLLRAGILHLCEGAPGRKPGMLTEAVRRASLRAAPLAATLGIAPPVYELRAYPAHMQDGYAEALFAARRFGEAAAHDLAVSRPVIARRLAHLRPAIANPVLQREARQFFAALLEARDANLGQFDRLLEKIG